jgi:hypothetical protein
MGKMVVTVRLYARKKEILVIAHLQNYSASKNSIIKQSVPVFYHAYFTVHLTVSRDFLSLAF